MNKNTIAKLIAGLEVVLDALKEEAGSVPSKQADVERTPNVVSTPSKEVVAKIAEEVAEEVVESTVNRQAELEAMNFNELKQYAKSIGVKAVGTKATILANILEVENNTETVEEEFTESHENELVDTKEEVKAKAVKKEEADVEEDDEDEEGKDLYDKIVKELEAYTDEELATILSDIGISPKGKRQALITKIISAIDDGKLEFETEEDEEDTSVDADEENGQEEDEAEVEVTPERAEAMEELEARIRKAYKDKGLTDKEVAEFLDAYHNGDYKGTKKENLENYIALQVQLIDDEGAEHDFNDPYYVAEKPFCCATELKVLDNGNMFCEICGTEYENDEE